MDRVVALRRVQGQGVESDGLEAGTLVLKENAPNRGRRGIGIDRKGDIEVWMEQQGCIAQAGPKSGEGRLSRIRPFPRYIVAKEVEKRARHMRVSLHEFSIEPTQAQELPELADG
jgi:hypothetical protein